MFSHTAQYYDPIYLAMKDYGAEADMTGPLILRPVDRLGLPHIDWRDDET